MATLQLSINYYFALYKARKKEIMGWKFVEELKTLKDKQFVTLLDVKINVSGISRSNYVHKVKMFLSYIKRMG